MCKSFYSFWIEFKSLVQWSKTAFFKPSVFEKDIIQLLFFYQLLVCTSDQKLNIFFLQFNYSNMLLRFSLFSCQLEINVNKNPVFMSSITFLQPDRKYGGIWSNCIIFNEIESAYKLTAVYQTCIVLIEIDDCI